MASLYLLVGYPGAGKTTTSKLLHQLTGAKHLWADHFRKQKFNQPTYSQAENDQLYDELNRQTAQLLANGDSVIYDTNFNFYKDRQRLRSIATQNGADCQLLWVQTPKAVAKQRATDRTNQQKWRVLGHMSEDDFVRLSGHLEEPRPDEQAIIVDGTKLDQAYLSSLIVKK